MKVKKIVAAMLAVTAVLGLMACGGQNEQLNDEPLTGGVLADFTQGEADTFFASHGWNNGGSFNVTWDESCIAYADGQAKMSIAAAPEGATVPYLGGELRTYQHFGYGDYSVRMKPLKVAGAVSTFFTYTGPSENDADGNPNPHDEIDIEFIGKDTTVVQFNYFVNGKGGNEYRYKLGFDASLEFHDYGFRWAEDYIVWFVDGKPVHKVKASAKNPLPSTPGRILMNHWTVNSQAENWAGKYKGPDGKTCEYINVKTSAKAIGELPEKVDLTVPETGWTDISVDPFDGWGMYDVNKDNGLTISHSTAFDKEYKCCGMDLADSYLWVKMHVKNNADAPCNMRIDIKEKLADANKAVGVVSEHSGVTYNLNDKAINISLGANEQADIAVKLDGTLVDQFVVFLNSIGALPDSGSVTLTELKGVINQNVTPPPPPADDKLVMIGTNEVAFGGAGYTVTTDAEKSAMTVTYTDIGGDNYNHIMTAVSDFVADSNTFIVTIKNAGTETAKVRIDIGCDEADGSANNNGKKNNFCNIKAEYTGTVADSGNDYIYGGADWVKIAAGQTVTAKIYFTANVAKDIKFYLDSSTYEDKGKYSGNVVFSAMSFGKEDAPEPPPPPPPADDKLVKIGTNEAVLAGEGYTVTASADKASATVEYTDIGGKDYNFISASIASFVADNNTFSVTIKNEGAETAKVRIDIGCDLADGSFKENGTDRNNFCNIKAEYTGTVADSGNDYIYGGADWVKIAAGETVTAKITFTANVAKDIKFFIDSSTYNDEGRHTGRIVLSAMELTKSGSDTPVTPPAGDGAELTFTSTPEYTVDNTGVAAKQITVTYTEIDGGTYKNIQAPAAELAAGNDTFSIKITNNGAAAARVRVDLIGTTSVGETDVCNLSHTATGGTDGNTDTTYGGTSITVAAGETITLVIKYDGAGERGAVQRVQLYMDSATFQDTAKYSGNITFGEFEFSKTVADE